MSAGLRVARNRPFLAVINYQRKIDIAAHASKYTFKSITGFKGCIGDSKQCIAISGLQNGKRSRVTQLLDDFFVTAWGTTLRKPDAFLPWWSKYNHRCYGSRLVFNTREWLTINHPVGDRRPPWFYRRPLGHACVGLECERL